MDPEDIARKAMLGVDVTAAPPILVAAPPKIEIAPEKVVVTEPETLADTTNAKPPVKWLAKIKPVVQTPYFRYVVLFIAICILLLIISPPFVQIRRKNQSALEKAPTSYKRVMITAGVITLVVAAAPLIYSHKAKIMSTIGIVKKWF